MELRLTPKHPTCAAATAIPVSGATSRPPTTQAAKKVGIEPQVFPVPPAESPVDGAGPQRGRKDGPPDSYLEPPNPYGSPFFFGFQKPFFFQQGKRNGFCRPRKVRTAASSQVSHPSPCPRGQVSLVPLFVLSPQGWSALWGSPGCRAFLTPLPCSSSPLAVTSCASLILPQAAGFAHSAAPALPAKGIPLFAGFPFCCAGLARGPHFCMWFGAPGSSRPTHESEE